MQKEFIKRNVGVAVKSLCRCLCRCHQGGVSEDG